MLLLVVRLNKENAKIPHVQHLEPETMSSTTRGDCKGKGECELALVRFTHQNCFFFFFRVRKK